MKKRYDQTLKEKIHLEYLKIKEMSRNECIEYLWEYYKVVIVGMIGIILFICAVNSMFQKARLEPALSLVVIDAKRDQTESVDTLLNDLNHYLKIEKKQEEVSLHMIAANQDNSANTIKTIIEFSPMETNDIVICNKEIYAKFNKEQAFADLRMILGEDYEQYQAYIYGNAIELFENDTWLHYGITSYEPVYLCVLRKATQKKNAKIIIEYFLN